MVIFEFLAASARNSLALSGSLAVAITSHPPSAYCFTNSSPRPRFDPVTSTVPGLDVWPIIVTAESRTTHAVAAALLNRIWRSSRGAILCGGSAARNPPYTVARRPGSAERTRPAKGRPTWDRGPSPRPGGDVWSDLSPGEP